jgi:hypothetical protein
MLVARAIPEARHPGMHAPPDHPFSGPQQTSVWEGEPEKRQPTVRKKATTTRAMRLNSLIKLLMFGYFAQQVSSSKHWLDERCDIMEPSTAHLKRHHIA